MYHTLLNLTVVYYSILHFTLLRNLKVAWNNYDINGLFLININVSEIGKQVWITATGNNTHKDVVLQALRAERAFHKAEMDSFFIQSAKGVQKDAYNMRNSVRYV